MARIRTVKPEFWTSESVVECSCNARLLLIGMLNFADDYGNLVNSPKRLKMQIFPADIIDTTPLLEELIKHCLVIPYSVDGEKYLNIKGFRKHQVINKPSKSKIPLPSFDKNVDVVADDECVTTTVVVDDECVTEGNGREWNGLNTKNNAHEVIDESIQVEKLKQGQFAKPDTFKITFEWKPSPEFETRCKMAGKDFAKFNDDILLSFINYNESREQYKTQKEWEGLLLTAFMRELARPTPKQQSPYQKNTQQARDELVAEYAKYDMSNEIVPEKMPVVSAEEKKRQQEIIQRMLAGEE
jgi:hypothetical protein